MGLLHDAGIVANADGDAAGIFESLFPSFLKVGYAKPSDYVNVYWAKYQEFISKGEIPNNNQNGKIFEYILATLLIRESITPIYLGAKVAFVPNVNYDLMLYAPAQGPICISAKTSLRERYKQADLEAIALKYVHRKALGYLITLEEREAKGCKEKIKKGDIIGLDDVVVASKPEFDDLIASLKKLELSLAPTVKVIEATQTITAERIANLA